MKIFLSGTLGVTNYNTIKLARNEVENEELKDIFFWNFAIENELLNHVFRYVIHRDSHKQH